LKRQNKDEWGLTAPHTAGKATGRDAERSAVPGICVRANGSDRLDADDSESVSQGAIVDERQRRMYRRMHPPGRQGADPC